MTTQATIGLGLLSHRLFTGAFFFKELIGSLTSTYRKDTFQSKLEVGKNNFYLPSRAA
jgi:hypothetical protein